MHNMPSNTECILNGSPFCALQNTAECGKCALNKLTDDEKYAAVDDMIETAKALPEDGILNIKGDECALCRREPKKASRFALIDMGHKNPAAEAGSPLSNGSDRGGALTVPVELPVCGACVRRIKTMSYLPKVLALAIVLGGLILVALEPVRLALVKYSPLLPVLIFLIFVFLGIIVDTVVKRLVSKRIERSTNVRTRRVAALYGLVSRGWFVIGEKNGVPPYVFVGEKLDSGFMTGDGRDALLETIRREGRALIGAKPEPEPENGAESEVEAPSETSEKPAADEEIKRQEAEKTTEE